jgi:competence protein ComEA
MNRIASIAVLTLSLCLSADALAARRKAAPVQMAGTLNLNTATPSQLDLLPGVGAKAAERILEYRKKTPFARVEELVKVKGFGKKKFDKLKAHLAVTGPNTLQVQRSTTPAATPSDPATAQGRAAPRRP